MSEKTKPSKDEIKKMMEVSYSTKQLYEFHKALNTLLAIKGTGFSFICIENIVKIKPIMEEYEESVKKLQESFYFKDDKGKPIKYVIQQKNIGGNILTMFKKDADGQLAIAKEGDQFQHRVNETDEYIESLKKFNKKPHEICFEIISRAKFKELTDEGGPLDGIDPEVTCLFGAIIK